MNSIFVQQALEKVGSKEILVVLVGERVRQLSSDHTPARPLVDCAGTESALNIALREIAEEKITFQLGNQDATCASFDESSAFKDIARESRKYCARCHS